MKFERAPTRTSVTISSPTFPRAALAALREHSGGRDDRFVRYVPLVLALEVAAAEAAEARLPDPAAAAEARAAAAAEEAAKAAKAAEETAEVAKAAKELAAAAIAAVCRGPDDPAEPIAELFHEHGFGARGLSRMEVTAFNRSYAPAVRAYNVASAGGVTPKVTNNHALELTEPRREPTNPLGRALQEQIDRKAAEQKEAAAREREFDRKRLAAAAAAAAEEEVAERDAKRNNATRSSPVGSNREAPSRRRSSSSINSSDARIASNGDSARTRSAGVSRDARPRRTTLPVVGV